MADQENNSVEPDGVESSEGGPSSDEESQEIGFDKIRQQIQQEIGNATRPLNDSIASLNASIESLSSRAASGQAKSNPEDAVADVSSLADTLKDLDDQDLVEGSTLKRLLSAVDEKLSRLGKMDLPEEVKSMLDGVKQDHEAKAAVDADYVEFGKLVEAVSKDGRQRPALMKRYQDFTSQAYKTIDADESMNDKDMVTVRKGLVREALKKPSSTPRSDKGTQYLHDGAATGTVSDGGQVERDANGLPMGLSRIGAP